MLQWTIQNTLYVHGLVFFEYEGVDDEFVQCYSEDCYRFFFKEKYDIPKEDRAGLTAN